MSKVRQNRRTDGVIEVGAILVGLVLVAYGLGMASWSSSSDSSTGFIDLSYGDPPYGFKETAWAKIVARPYFNRGAWILVGDPKMLDGLDGPRREALLLGRFEAVSADDDSSPPEYDRRRAQHDRRGDRQRRQPTTR